VGTLNTNLSASFPVTEKRPSTNSLVMAGMNYAYSSVHTHLSGHGNLGIVKVNRRLDLIDD
jgi:hypothetical protein